MKIKYVIPSVEMTAFHPAKVIAQSQSTGNTTTNFEVDNDSFDGQ